MDKYRKNVITASVSIPKGPYYHYCMPAAAVSQTIFRPDRKLSDPVFLPAYEWIEQEVGFYPLFLAVGRSESALMMTGYHDNWRVWTGGDFIAGQYRKKYRRKGEFPNLALLSFKEIDGVFMDYDTWHIALNAFPNGDAISEREKRMIFKPSWKKSRWIRAALDGTHYVQLVTPDLPLNKASIIRVRNTATCHLLKEKGFRNVETLRLPVKHLSR